MSIFNVYFFSFSQQNELEYKNKNTISNQVEKKEVEPVQHEATETFDNNRLNQAFESAKSEFSLQYKLLQTQTSKKSFDQKEREVLDKQLAVMALTGKSTFEYNFYSYLAGNYDTDKFDYLEKAAFLSPGNSEVWEEMLGYYYIMNNELKAQTYLKLLKQKEVYDRSLIDYAKDVLKSVENGVLLTHGERDTYPLLIANEELGLDVEIINIDFLTSDTYRQSLREKDYVLPEGQFINTVYVNMFLNLNSDKKIHVAMTLPKDYLSSLNEKLATKGLTYRFNEEVSYKVNQKIWNSLDKVILKKESRLAQSLSANYIPLLKFLYEAEKNEELKKNYKEQVKVILKGINREDQLNTLLDSEK